MAKELSDTKIQILESCITAKSWSELREITKVSEPSLLSHVNELQEQTLLSKNSERHYQTTKKGLEMIDLIPYVRTTSSKTPLELKNMVRIGLKPTVLPLEQRIKFELGGIFAIEHDKTLNKIYTALTKTIVNSVTLRLPQGLEPDKAMWQAVNRLVGVHTKKTHKNIKYGKLTMVIEFNLETALDMVIRDEQDEEIKNHLIENREKILTKLYKSYQSLTSEHII